MNRVENEKKMQYEDDAVSKKKNKKQYQKNSTLGK